jgi:hypothetical protein
MEYKNVIFTRHGLQRLYLRNISKEMAVQAIQLPDKKEKEPGENAKFIKSIGGREVHIVATYLRSERQWMVVSAWVRGEDDPPLWKRIMRMAIYYIRN